MSKIHINNLTNNELLETKISQLDLVIPTKYQDQLSKLYILLKKNDIMWKPYYWLADEWFSPDGHPGFAIPFILCSPKLIELEKKYLGHCEGESPKEFFKLCVHETGHAIDNAYKLRLKKERQNIFGLSSTKYPKSYAPQPFDPNFVVFLDDFYAQAHPDEDWAETFSVWLTDKNWIESYSGTNAIKKLLYINKLINSIANINTYNKKIKVVSHYKQDNRTVKQYLTQKKKSLGLTKPNFFENKISTQIKEGIDLSLFIQQNKKEILSNNTSIFWQKEKCLSELKDICRSKKIRVNSNNKKNIRDIQKVLDENIDSFIAQGKTRIYM